MKRCFLLLSLVLAVTFIYANDVDVTAYGAKGDSATLNTVFLQKAIDDCHAHGGGRVIFPAGKYLSGTIILRDNVTLLLRKDAMILGSTDVEHYQNMDPFTDGLGIEVGWALVVAVDAKNIGIEGEGSINGQGARLKAKQIETDTRPEGQRWGRRPFLLRIVRCNGVQVKGVTLLYAAAWTSHYFQSTDVHIENVKIVSRGVAHNDGIDIDGCQHVRISNCDITSGDDALCFKTTSSKMDCSDIEVRGMKLKSGQGAIKMGTESMAPFENIRISDCYIYDTNNGGIKLLTVDGAHLRNVEIAEIKMVNVKTPILIRLGSRLSVFRKNNDVQQTTGTLEHVVIKNVEAISSDTTQLKPASGILITGVPGHDITDLRLENIRIDLPGGGTVADGRHAVPEAVDKYPEVKTFGPFVPAYGLWARHVTGLHLVNIQLKLKNNDQRPAFVFQDAKNIEVINCSLPTTAGSESLILFEKVDGAVVSGTTASSNADAFLRLQETDASKIKLSKNKVEGTKKIVEVKKPVALSN